MSTFMASSQTPQARGSGIDYRFKILYALGMVFIVACHCENGGISLFYDWFPPYSFHLPLFTFCSGYFYKEQSENYVLKYCINKAKHLLIPLYLWNCFYAVLVPLFRAWGIGTELSSDIPYVCLWLKKLIVSPITDGQQFIFNLGGWFVFPLLLVQYLNVTLRRIVKRITLKHKEHFLFLFYLLLGIAGVQMAIKFFHSNSIDAMRNTIDYVILNVYRVLFFLPFFGAGIYYKKVLEKIDHIPNTLYFGIILALKLVIFLFYQTSPQYSPGTCDDFTEGPILPFIVGFLGIAFWLRIARILEPAIGRSKIVNLIADNTFSIMVNQFLGFMAINTLYAIVSNYLPLPNFDIYQYKTNIFYVYYLRGMEQSLIIYLVAGIFIPILLQLGVNHINKLFKSTTKTI